MKVRCSEREKAVYMASYQHHDDKGLLAGPMTPSGIGSIDLGKMSGIPGNWFKSTATVVMLIILRTRLRAGAVGIRCVSCFPSREARRFYPRELIEANKC